MADLQEMFREATDRVAPGHGALDRQHRRQRQRRRRERGLVFGLTAALVAAFFAVIVATRSSTPSAPADHGTSAPVVTSQPVLEEVDPVTGATGTPLIREVAPEQVDVSPDGSHIVFVRSRAGHDQLFLANSDGTEISALTAANDVGCGCGVHEPDWAPDGTTIAFRGADLAGNQDIYVVDVGTGAVERITTAPTYEGSPDWSPDGTTIAFTRGDGDHPSVWLIGAGEDSRAVRLSEGSAPAWSPDGQTIAFTRAAGTGDGSDIWTIATDGSSAEELTDRNEFDSTPAWLPDGTQIAFTAFRPGDDTPTAIAAVDLRTRQVYQLASGLSEPAWTPEGSLLAIRT